MSTSSGRASEGPCSRCGHSMEQHQKLQLTKCKKCKRSFEVCQSGVHGDNGAGWRICYVPCSCGEKYYPLGLTRAHELAPHEYQTNHVAYRPFTPEGEEIIDESGLDEVTESFDNIDIGEPGPSSSGGGGHVRVDSGGTDELAWDQSAVKTGSHAQPWSRWVWEEDKSRYYRSRAGASGKWEFEYDYKTPGPEIGKGKGKRESGGSEDELAWDQSTVYNRIWSDWTWEERYSRYYRSRPGDSGGDWEYEYDYETAGPVGAKQRGSRKGNEKRKK